MHTYREGNPSYTVEYARMWQETGSWFIRTWIRYEDGSSGVHTYAL